ncbi:MAG: phosphoglycerate kinase [Chlamydiota bacterium]|nr:phosphoglycerate kinase [Chlamydiota bacterium]
MHKLSITDLPIKGKRVIMRVDFNVPLDSNGNITDATRISSAIHSIKYVLDNGGSLILMSHLGRPKGKIVPALSLKPVAKYLEKMIGTDVIMAPDCIGKEVQKLAENLKPGQVLLLENLRFHSAEEHPEEDPKFAKELASLADLYVNNAFGTAHRSHSSTVTITNYFKDKSAAGFLLEKEIQFLGSKVSNPERPFFAIVGGAKVSSKIGVLRSLLKKVDALFIGGGMAYTFFKAKGFEVGESLHEDDLIEEAKNILSEAEKNGIPLYLPVDNVVADRLSEDANTQVVDSSSGIPLGHSGVDIGPKTIEMFSKKLNEGKTILWNGPLGIFEIGQFAKGTKAIAKVIVNLDAITIVGGGDSVAAVQSVGYADRVTHISTGGGAALEYIEFEKLPAIEALSSPKVQSP